ncbi:MAG: insulinase family protein, partial [Pseudohongiellaceae bacterium]
MLLTFTSQSVETDSIDPVFGGEYSFRPLSEQSLASWSEGVIDPALAITEPNPFMPEDLSLKSHDGESQVAGAESKPDLLLDDNGVRLWFQHDDEFEVPRANFYFYAMMPVFSDSLENSLLSSFVISLVNDKHNEYSYPANLAGVFYGVSRRSRGFTVRLGGYQDKQAILLEEVLNTIVEADFDQARFDIIKTEMIRSWENADKQTPYVRLFQEIQALLVDPYWSEQEKIAAVADIGLDQVKAFIPRMLNNITIDALYHGNVVEDDALRMLDIVMTYLEPSPQVDRPPFGTVVMLEPEQKIIQEVEVEHEDSAIVIYQQGPDDSLETRATINLLSTILRTPFYEELRTRQQLGYVVNAGTMPILNTNGVIMY